MPSHEGRPSGRTRTRATQTVAADSEPSTGDLGPVASAVAADLMSLTVTDGHAALAATAMTLARQLDEGAGMAAAAIARELRVTLDAIRNGGAGDDDDVASLFRELSASVQHTTQPGA